MMAAYRVGRWSRQRGSIKAHNTLLLVLNKLFHLLTTFLTHTVHVRRIIEPPEFWHVAGLMVVCVMGIKMTCVVHKVLVQT